jgi:predicted house-cleaning noncanonical NTP pyrophosphatase (MazG superfamily)
MAKAYNKLVRDKVPEIIENEKKIPHIKVLEDDQLTHALIVKLKEKIDEYSRSRLIDDLAGIQEVVLALIDNAVYSIDDFEDVRMEILDRKGGFEKGILLQYVE